MSTERQQVVPTVKWCRDVLKAKTFFLIGTDSVWPHAVNAVVKDQLKAIGATLLGEEYVVFGTESVDVACGTRPWRPSPTSSSARSRGETNLQFYRRIRGPGSEAAQDP